ncbi:MAG: dUTP diphosphatase [Firmicutes bacterium]|nr:dUTP diphosphatase [Bacillota bacterium]
MDKVIVEVQKLEGAEDLPLPRYMTPGAAGMDLFAAVPKTSPISIQPGSYKIVPTGIRLAIPQGYEGQVRPRSGLALKWGITVLNSPGTIDADYRGEVKVILINHGQRPYIVERGERIAQLVINKLPQVLLVEKSELQNTSRGEGSFGHTG